MNPIIELKLTPVRKMFYGNDYGVYACESRSPDVEYNAYDNFVINGGMQELSLGAEYIASIELKENKKYGKGYEVHSIRQELPTTIEGQHAFLRTILSESQCEPLIKAYPTQDIIQLIKDNTLDYNKIRGIGDKKFTKIRDKVIKNIDIQEALVELSKYGVSYTIVQKLLARYNNSPTLVVQKVKANPYILCDEVNGLGFDKVDKYAIKTGVEVDSPYRIESAIYYMLKQAEKDGNCWTDKTEIIQLAAGMLSLPEAIIIEFMSNGNLKSAYIDESKIALKKTYMQEKKICDKISQLVKSENIFRVDNIDDKIKVVEDEQGFQFTDEQRQAIYDSIDNNVMIISGKAGCGKTALLKGIIKILSEYTYDTCAFSGKAAQRITESTGLKSQTIHRILQFNPKIGEFMCNEGSPIPVQSVYLDEGSMTPTSLFYHLSVAVANGHKLIILGDVGQLSAIGCGRPFIDLIESGVIKVCELTKVHRQAMKSGILLAANEVREGKQIIKSGDYKPKVIGELKDLYLYPKETSQQIFDHIIHLCKNNKDRFDLMEFQVVVPLKKKGVISANNLNIELQKIFNDRDEQGLKRGDFVFKTGDKVIKNGNDYDNGVFNGTLGKIVEIDYDEDTLSIDFIGIDDLVTYKRDQLLQIDLAYALTGHRVQGSQFKQGIFALDYAAYKLLNRQGVYTGMTRFSEMCVMIFELKALIKAIRTNDTNKRNTFLKDMLIEEFNK